MTTTIEGSHFFGSTRPALRERCCSPGRAGDHDSGVRAGLLRPVRGDRRSFLVFSSNICALLGLRASYFVVRGALARLRYLKPGWRDPDLRRPENVLFSGWTFPPALRC